MLSLDKKQYFTKTFVFLINDKEKESILPWPMFWFVSFWVVGLWPDTKELGGFLWMEAGFDRLSMGGFCLVLMGGWVVNWVVDF